RHDERTPSETRPNAVTPGSSASIRASTASVSSTGEICFDRMRAASSVAGRHTNSSTFLSINALYHSASWTLAGRPSVSEARRLRSRTSWRSPKSWPSSDTVRRCATRTLPAGAGTAVLNVIASLARDQGRDSLRYGGPYPTEQLFTTLLDSFHYDTTPDDPLAAFSRGELDWRPAPHERVFTPEGACVYLRERVEKVVWRSRVYQRPNAQGIGRHAAYRVRDTDGRVVCSLWALGTAIEDTLELDEDGHVVKILEPPAQPAEHRALPPEVADAIGAIV